MLQATEQELMAMRGLKAYPQFDILLGWFKKSLAAQRESNDAEAVEYLLRQGQGKALQLDDILKQVSTASDTVERIRSAPERHAQERDQY